MIDLHSHSTASDGSYSPSQLVELALKLKLTALALTDHDTLDGIEEFMQAASGTNLLAIPGIELAARDPETKQGYHIVGLNLRRPSERMNNLLSDVIRWRYERNIGTIARLNGLGFPLTLEEVQKFSGGGVLGRPHIALALVEKGYVSEFQSAFDRLLATGKPGYVSRQLPTPAQAISVIHDMGGLAIWAHPFTRGNFTVTQTRRMAVELKDCGLDGIEAYYSLHTPTQTRNGLEIAKAVGLLVSGGSDFHGSRFKKLDLGTGYGGLSVPDRLLDNILGAGWNQKTA